MLNCAEDLRYGIDEYDISFYRSGAIKKLETGEETAKDCTLTCSLGEVFVKANSFPLMFWEDDSLKRGISFMLKNKKGSASIEQNNIGEAILTAYPQGRANSYYSSSKEYWAAIAPNVYMLYFADNGFPSSYDVIQPINGLTLTFNNFVELTIECRFGNYYDNGRSWPFFLQMTEDDEFIISKERIRNLEFTEK